MNHDTDHSGIRHMEQQEMDAMYAEHCKFWRGLMFALLFAAMLAALTAAVVWCWFHFHQ